MQGNLEIVQLKYRTTSLAGSQAPAVRLSRTGFSAGTPQAAPDRNLAYAMFNIDPCNSEGASRIALPGLYWGFNVTTCFVEKTDAAMAAYYDCAGSGHSTELIKPAHGTPAVIHPSSVMLLFTARGQRPLLRWAPRRRQPCLLTVMLPKALKAIDLSKQKQPLISLLAAAFVVTEIARHKTVCRDRVADIS